MRVLLVFLILGSLSYSTGNLFGSLAELSRTRQLQRIFSGEMNCECIGTDCQCCGAGDTTKACLVIDLEGTPSFSINAFEKNGIERQMIARHEIPLDFPERCIGENLAQVCFRIDITLSLRGVEVCPSIKVAVLNGEGNWRELDCIRLPSNDSDGDEDNAK